MIGGAFTPGPWRIVKHTKAPDADLGPHDDWTIESVQGGICWEAQGRGAAQTEANARLIAAAPELYEALEELFDIVSRNGLAMSNRANTALRKARGETL